MKSVFKLISFSILLSCSSSREEQGLSQRIQREEVRSLQEIKSHARFLLESHPELDRSTKMELSTLLDMTIVKQQELKDEESKIIQLILSKSLSVNQLSVTEKNNLKMRLRDVYEEKSKNVLFLINKIVSFSERNVINDRFRKDMIDFIRDTR